jgi:hypothetical protein
MRFYPQYTRPVESRKGTIRFEENGGSDVLTGDIGGLEDAIKR